MTALMADAFDAAVGTLALVDITAHHEHLAFHAGDSIATFACHSSSCRPPGSGGTGGSLPGGGRVGVRSPTKGGTGQTTLAFGEISKEGLAAQVARLHAVGALPAHIKTADQAADYIAENVLSVYHRVTPENVAAWKEWYVGANKLGHDLSGPDLPHHAANASIAVLSPGTDWNVNIAQTRAALGVLRANRPLTAVEAKAANGLAAESFTRQHAAWEAKSGVANAQLDVLRGERAKATNPAAIKKLDKAIKAKTIVASHPEPTIEALPHFKTGQRPSDVPADHTGYMFRAQVPNPVVQVIKIRPDGTYDDSEIARTKAGKAQAAGWQSYYNLTKLTSIYRDPSMENISAQLGSAHKVRSFFNNINDPHNPAGDVTVDCFDTETEVLSQRGWLKYDEVTSDDLVYTRNLATGMGEWGKVNYVFVGEYDGPMMLMRNKTHGMNARCTPHHNWITQNRTNGIIGKTQAADLRTQHTLVTTAALEDGPGLPEGMASAFGWIMAEGHYPPNWRTAIKISQSHRVNPLKCAEIGRVLDLIGCTWSLKPNRPATKDEYVYIIRGEMAADVRANLMPDKTIAPWVIASMTKEDAEAFLEAYIDGDGWRSKTSRYIATKNPANADAIEAIAALAGYYTYRLSRPGGMMHVTIRKPRPIRVEGMTREYEQHNGLIWCPNTDNGTAFFRRRGTTFMSGQTHAFGIGLNKPLSISHPWIKSGKQNITMTGGSAPDGTSGAYTLFNEGYKRAAAKIGIEPREVQSVVWEQWRREHSIAERAANVKRISKGGAFAVAQSLELVNHNHTPGRGHPNAARYINPTTEEGHAAVAKTLPLAGPLPHGTILYHLSATTNRESILKTGLEAGRSLKGQKFRVYADSVQPTMEARSDSKPHDLYQIDAGGLKGRQDPELPGRWTIIEQDVAPGRLRLLSSTDPDRQIPGPTQATLFVTRPLEFYNHNHARDGKFSSSNGGGGGGLVVGKVLSGNQMAVHFTNWLRMSKTKEWGTGGPHDTSVQHMQDGKWTVERDRIHQGIANGVIVAAIKRGVPTEHQVVVMGGLGGSGKSSILRNQARAEAAGVKLGPGQNADHPSSHLVINPDVFKEQLIRRGLVDRMPGMTPMESAHLVHEESSRIARMVQERAAALGMNIILDRTLSSSTKTLEDLSPDGMLGGYIAHGIFTDVSPSKSLASTEHRYANGVRDYLSSGVGLGGRPVPPSIIDEASRGLEGTTVPTNSGTVQPRSINRVAFQQLIDAGVFSSARVYDNEGDGTTNSYPATLSLSVVGV